MKKVLCLSMVLLLAVSLLAGCGSKPTGSGSTADYTTVLQASRNQELNDVFNIVTSVEEDKAGILDFMKLAPNTMQKYAISTSIIIIQAYSVCIILPVAGHEQEIKDQLAAFVEAQKKAFDGYLAPQYEIAKNAKIEVAETGEILLVMAEDAATVMQSLKDGLKNPA